jgi:7 transmembrane helices usually fused to an inactive transglutaminase/Inactive transglutaminase fused to 7 transmembrane helices
MWRTAFTFTFAAICILIGLGVATYKHYNLKFPLSPNTEINSWYVDLQATFQSPSLYNPEIQPEISIIKPSNNYDYALVNLQSMGRGFGKNIIKGKEHTELQFTKRKPATTETIYLRFMLYELNEASIDKIKLRDIPSIFKINEYSKEKRVFNPDESLAALYTTIDSVIDEVVEKSSSPASFASELWKILAAQGENKAYLMQAMQLNENALYVKLLQVAGYPARLANGFILKNEMVRSASFKQWVEVFEKGEWIKFDAERGDFIEKNSPYYTWWIGEDSLVKTQYFKKFITSVAIKPNSDSAMSRALWESKQKQPLAYKLAIPKLHIEQQAVLQILLLLPLGGLVVAFIRQVIGVRCFGTFMPVLISLAMHETGLINGLMLFCGLVTIGLILRGYLKSLRLLFVPRLAAVLTMVVGLITILMLLLQDTELSVGGSVALFPVVIMTMSIERMSNMWEEKGAKNALMTFAYTMIIASGVYLITMNEYVKHAMLIFPELLLVIFGLCLILGRYNGYRLTEYMRFRQLRRSLEAIQERSSASENKA